jgi:ferredoxin
MKHCPALAYSKDPDSGAVVIDPQSCIGCKYCSWACPYDAPQFNRASGTVEKCTLCTHRIDDGLDPACVALCPTGALRFGNVEGGECPVVPGFTKTDIGPAIRIVPHRHWNAQEPRPAGRETRRNGAGVAKHDSGRIKLRSEWTLMAFSFMAALLVGRFTASLVPESTSPFDPAKDIHPWLLPVLGVVAMSISTLHLGRPRRAWRAALNWRRSWLSREVLLFPAFLLLSSTSVFLDSGGRGGALDWIAATVGFALLFTVDSVYEVTGTRGLRFHSARVFLTGLLFAGLFSANAYLFVPLAALKAALYLWRKYGFYSEGRRARPWFSRARVVVGLLTPLVLWWNGDPELYPVVVAAVVVGELIDRAEYYLELDAPSPARQMDTDLAAILLTKG